MQIRLLLIINLMFAITLQLSSQDRREKVRERIESNKVAYLSEKLNLTTEEAQVFWPLYNEYNTELKKERRNKQENNLESITDDEASKMIDKHIEIQQSELDIKKRYLEKIKSTIGAKKTLMLWRYDRQFKEDMIRKLKRREHKDN
jgi:hypothetical protein